MRKIIQKINNSTVEKKITTANSGLQKWRDMW